MPGGLFIFEFQRDEQFEVNRSKKHLIQRFLKRGYAVLNHYHYMILNSVSGVSGEDHSDSTVLTFTKNHLDLFIG